MRRGAVRGSAGAALALALVAADPAAARELWRRGDAALEVRGSVREVATLTHGTDASSFARRSAADLSCALADRFPDCPAFAVVGDKDVWQSLTRLRIRIDARLNAQLSAVVTYDHEILGGILDTLGASLGASTAVERFLDLEWDLEILGFDDGPEDHRRWRHLLYRGYLRLETGRFEVVVGRQRIPWGVGRIWNPIDRFNFIPPLAVEGDQTPGVDAIDVRFNFSGFTYLEAVYTPNGSRDEAAYALRLHGGWGEMDYSAVAGRWQGAWATGLDLAGNLADAAVRLEAVWTRPTDDVWRIGRPAPETLDPFWQVVVSADYNVDLGSGLYVLVEYLYNGNALGFGEGRAGVLLPFFETTDETPPGFVPPPPPPPAPLFPGGPGVAPPAPPPPTGAFVGPGSAARFGGSAVVTAARHQTGLQLGYDLTPVLRLDGLVLYDWNGHSVALAPVLGFTPTDSLELRAGLQVFFGPRRSQYGSAAHLAFLQLEWFF